MVWYGMAWHAMAFHTIPYHTIPYHAMPHHTIPYHSIQYHTIPYYTIPYHTIPYHTIPYHSIPYHTIPYHTIPKLYHNQDDLIHTNICNSTKTSFTILIPPYRYIPLSLIVDHDLNILPPSELDHRIPLTDWDAIKPLTILMATSNLRHKINKSSLTGNFEPFYPPELQITNPNLKGCKLFFNALSNHSFESKHWTKFNQFQSDHEIAPEILEKQIIKLSNTSRAIEAKDLQYRVLRNTCITNNKLYRMKILDTPNCTLCNHQTQDSTHRFYYCPQAQKTWQLLTNKSINK